MSQVEVVINIELPDDDRQPANLILLENHKQYCTEVINTAVNDLAQRGELDASIRKVIITDSYEAAVEEQADTWDVGRYYHIKERGFTG